MMILRSCTCASLALLLSAVAAPPAFAAEDQASAVVADCGAADLPDSQVDTCLERARVLDETDPSPQLQSLEAQLEQRATGKRTASREPRALQSPPSSASSDMTPYQPQPSVVESDRQLPPNAAEPDQTRSAAAEVPATRVPDERYRDERRSSVYTGAEQPPAGINDDQPPVADPPDHSQDEADDPQ
jgi:hypothetical protein